MKLVQEHCTSKGSSVTGSVATPMTVAMLGCRNCIL